jgi:hypothetical protein
VTNIAACGSLARGLAFSAGETVAPGSVAVSRGMARTCVPSSNLRSASWGSGLGSPRHGTHAQTQVFRAAKSSKLVYYTPPEQRGCSFHGQPLV